MLTKKIENLENRRREKEGLLKMIEDAKTTKDRIEQGMDTLLTTLKRENDYMKNLNPDLNNY